MCAIRLYNADFNLLLVNVYMPCELDEAARNDFCSVLSVVTSISQSFPDAMLIVGGDFNVDISRNTTHTSEFVRFCTDLNMMTVNQHPKSKVDFTYHFGMKRFSTIDHFVLPKYVFDTSINEVAVIHDADNLSDHEPLLLQIGIHYTPRTLSAPRHTTTKPAWYKANDGVIQE